MEMGRISQREIHKVPKKERTCWNKTRMSKKTQHAKAMEANTFKKKSKKSGISKPRKSILYQVDLTGAEKKAIDTTSTLAPPLTASFTACTLLNGCAQGVGNSERIGRKMCMKSISLRYIHQPTSGGPNSQVRILIIYDKQTNGSLPANSDIIPLAQFIGHLNLSNADRFVVLMDEISESSQSSALTISGKRYLKCNLETVFGGTTNGIASINSGGVYILAANNSDLTVGAVSALWYQVRIRYTDV